VFEAIIVVKDFLCVQKTSWQGVRHDIVRAYSAAIRELRRDGVDLC